MAEAKLRGEAVDMDVVEAAARKLRDMPEGERIDTVVLACTHFPLLEDELRAAFGPEVQVVHGAQGIARRIAHLTQGQSFAASQSSRFIATGNVQSAQALLPALKKHGFSGIEAF